MKDKNYTYTALLAGMFALLFVSNSILAKENKIESEFTVTQSNVLTNSEKESVSHTAAFVLAHTEEARNAIRVNDSDSALEQAEKALGLIEIIEQSTPTYTIDSKITSNGEIVENQYKIHPLEVPVFDSFDGVSVLEPMKRNMIKANREGYTYDQQTTSLDHCDRIAILDVALAKADLINAKEALKLEKTKEADTFLSYAQNTVRFEVKIDSADLVHKMNISNE